MATLEEIKELEAASTPLFLFECTLVSGETLFWSTHAVSVGGNDYLPRIAKHNAFELRSSADDATDGTSRISISLANADSFFSPIEQTTGWKNSQLTVKFLFYDLAQQAAASDSRVVFRGIGNAPDESTETLLRLTFNNRFNLQRAFLPDIRIQKRCPWAFPVTEQQRKTALDGGARGAFSPYYRCGYAPDQGGPGNLNNGQPFTTCDYTRANCSERGMFKTDSAGSTTARFGGVEFVPSTILVRSYGEKSQHVSSAAESATLYNDFVPLVYGTGWYQPPVVFARNDGNLTRMEVLLGAGEMTQVIKILVNDIEIPAGQPGTNMTGTGWFNVITTGTRSGAFNPDFADASGVPQGDPYGSMAAVSVVVPNRISDGRSVPTVKVLARGLKLAQYDSSGGLVKQDYSNNPAWVLLDVLQRSGWSIAEIDTRTFASAAAVCDELLNTVDVHGNPTQIPRYQCNLIITRRRSASDVVRGIRNNASLYLNLSPAGLLQLNVEGTLAAQQSTLPEGSNATEVLNGGYPAYEFNASAIARKQGGPSSVRVYSRTSAETPNRFSIEFQDEFNEYQQDSLSLVDVDDATASGSEVSATLPALGIPNFDQAARITVLQLRKAIDGNTYVDFDSSVRALCVRPGDIVALTYAKEGFDRQPFRIIRVAPGANYRTVTFTAQIHSDDWYSGAEDLNGLGTGRQGGTAGLPRPLSGSSVDSDGNEQFDVKETIAVASDGSTIVNAAVSFTPPPRPSPSGPPIPLLSLGANTSTTGGTLKGGQTLYYAVSGVAADGSEGALSFTVPATIPAGTATNTVALENLSFAQQTASFRVYRGVSPTQLALIAAEQPIAATFTDGGLTAQLTPPPDANYDHANFYWRTELVPQTAATIFDASSIGTADLGLLAHELRGATVRITGGAGAGQERTVTDNSDTTVTVSPKWAIVPDATSTYVVADSSWQFGASVASSPAMIMLPDRAGLTVHFSGRAANARDEETPYAMSPLTRYTIGGSGAGDSDVPPAPVFAATANGQGLLEIGAISFPTLENTQTVTAGTVTVGYWDELKGTPTLALAADVTAAVTTLQTSANVTFELGDLIQIAQEVMSVTAAVDNTTSVPVVRGMLGTVSATHATGDLVYGLEVRTAVLPFPKQFFGSPASGSYTYKLQLPNVRVATAAMFVTNVQGNSDVSFIAFTGTQDQGLRTLAGGQITLQVEGPIAIQTGAVPPAVVDRSCSVRDVFALVGTAPSGSSVDVEVTANGQTYCRLSIPDGQTASVPINGTALPPLAAGAQLGLNVLGVPSSANSTPGRDLTVTIRL